jgi:hypothetical protein
MLHVCKVFEVPGLSVLLPERWGLEEDGSIGIVLVRQPKMEFKFDRGWGCR